ncbi:MAG: AbrB/MazE/SpoVT family DNA-binding domain-containing protein [Methanomicrobiales archaeon]|nr:AbrB/MazE/SpoVT family DNA-binding domain-containing protein [Methanomicrobiales archaeon]
MDIRKIQISGGSSYIVSLPKEWIVASNIKKNDPVGIFTQGDGTLLITPNISSKPASRVKEFEVSATTDATFLLRNLISAYIAGFTSIRIWARARLPPFAMLLARDFTNMAIGQEVVEETETAIVIKDLLNPAEMPFESTIRRMSVIVRGMQEDAVGALESHSRELAESVVSRDTEVDRLHWLVARQNNLLVMDPNLARRMGITVRHAQHYFMISRIIERIGDHATRIGRNIILLGGNPVEPALISEIAAANGTSLDLFRRSMQVFAEGDIPRANETINRLGGLETACNAISTSALAYDPGTAIPIVHIIDSIRRIGEYSSDICENVMNVVTGE